MEQQTPPPPPPNQGWSRAQVKTRYFPILDLGDGGGGGTDFPSILSKIEGNGRNFSGKTLFLSCVCCQISNSVNFP